jgi:hypothetical protein
LRVHASAGKHGVAAEDAVFTAEDAVFAAEHPLFVRDLDEDDPQRQLRLGFDRAAGCSSWSSCASKAAMSWSSTP